MRGDFACRRSDRKIATRAANTRMVGSFSNRDAIGCKAANYHNPPLLANESLRLPDVRTTLWEGAGTTGKSNIQRGRLPSAEIWHPLWHNPISSTKSYCYNTKLSA